MDRPRRRRRAPEPPPSSQWTTAHVVIALVVGLGVGGIGGYFGGQDDGTQSASKDQGQAPTASQVAAGPVQPQPQLKQPPKRPQAQTGPVYVALAAHSPRKGPANAKVTILEFSDFQ